MVNVPSSHAVSMLWLVYSGDGSNITLAHSLAEHTKALSITELSELCHSKQICRDRMQCIPAPG